MYQSVDTFTSEVCLGKSDRGDEHVVHIRHGFPKFRIAKRKTSGQRWDLAVLKMVHKEQFCQETGMERRSADDCPWSTMVAQASTCRHLWIADLTNESHLRSKLTVRHTPNRRSAQ